MCQQSEAEHNYLVSRELREIKDRYAQHVSGAKPLTDDELKALAIKKLVLLG